MKTKILINRELIRTSSLALLMGIVVLGAVLRFYNLGNKEFSITELNIVRSIDFNYAKMIEERLWLAHNPLFCIIIKFISENFGSTEFNLRFLSALLGSCSVYVLFLIGKALFDTKTALVASFLLAISRFNLFYSQWLRSNGPCLFFVLLSIYFFIKAVNENKGEFWRKYGLLRVIALYLHGLPILVTFLDILYFIFFIRDGSRVKNFLKSMSIIIISLAPFWFYFAFQIPETAGSSLLYTTELSAPNLSILKEFYISLNRSSLSFGSDGEGIYLYPVFCFLGIVLSFLKHKRDICSSQIKKHSKGIIANVFLLLLLIFPVLVLFFVSKIWIKYSGKSYSFFDDAYLVPVEAAYVMFVARGCVLMPEIMIRLKGRVQRGYRLVGVILFTGLLALGAGKGIKTYYGESRPEWKKALVYINGSIFEREDLIVFPAQKAIFLQHYLNKYAGNLRLLAEDNINLKKGKLFWIVISMGSVKNKSDYMRGLKAEFEVIEIKKFQKLLVLRLQTKKEKHAVKFSEIIEERIVFEHADKM